MNREGSGGEETGRTGTKVPPEQVLTFGIMNSLAGAVKGCRRLERWSGRLAPKLSSERVVCIRRATLRRHNLISGSRSNGGEGSPGKRASGTSWVTPAIFLRAPLPAAASSCRID